VFLCTSLLKVSAAYTCDPTTCVAPDCHCASDTPPLPLEQMPQFVVYTHDDSTGEVSVGLLNQSTSGFKNPNGCSIPVTFFTMEGFTECDMVQAAWKAGNEIATHTWSHMAMPPGFRGGLGSIDKEIVSVRDWLVNNCSVPAADVVGFRSPFLVHNPSYRQVLESNGFLYDSSINEHWPMPSSPTGATRLYPYTMDAGIPQDCSWISGNVCTPTETYKGLWEVPVWTLQTDTYPTPAYAMDPCTGESGACDTTQLLKSVFNLAYNGNKAPVPIYIHSPWLADNVSSNSVFS
jgi:peptidoglycan/xylan/chitin deacetylase (PgdA/CDA1 family)